MTKLGLKAVGAQYPFLKGGMARRGIVHIKSGDR